MTGTRNRAGGYRLGAARTRQLDQTEPASWPGPSSSYHIRALPASHRETTDKIGKIRRDIERRQDHPLVDRAIP
jgi:hypothetical protein